MTAPRLLACLLLLGVVSCGSPTEPAVPNDSLEGSWRGSVSRAPCGEGWGEDWTTVYADLFQTGTAVTGAIYAPSGRRFPVTSGDATSLAVGGLDGTSTCAAFTLSVNAREHDGRGNVQRFSGTLSGRCCGTVAGSFSFERR